MVDAGDGAVVLEIVAVRVAPRAGIKTKKRIVREKERAAHRPAHRLNDAKVHLRVEAIAEESFGRLKRGVLNFINQTHFERLR